MKMSSDGRRSLDILRPASACNLSLDGDGLRDREGVAVGRGSREIRGRPLAVGLLSIVVRLSVYEYQKNSLRARTKPWNSCQRSLSLVEQLVGDARAVFVFALVVLVQDMELDGWKMKLQGAIKPSKGWFGCDI